MSQAAQTYERFDEGRIGVRTLVSGTDGPQLLLFPHAGAQSLAFRMFAGELPETWRVLGIDPPGHGWSAGPPLDDVSLMAKLYSAQLPDHYLRGTVFFGHSLGGLVAFKVAQILSEQGRPIAELILSAARPPHRKEDYVSFSSMDDQTLLDVLIKIGGIPATWANEPEVFDYFKDSVRADFRAFDRLMALEPLERVPVLALGGMEDAICRPEHVFEWSRYCANCQVDFVPGGHLYIQENPTSVVSRVLPFVNQCFQR